MFLKPPNSEVEYGIKFFLKGPLKKFNTAELFERYQNNTGGSKK